jgi:serine protease Do
VQIQPVTEIVAESLGLKKQQGALVASVVPEGPADRAGIEAGDVILRMNGEDLEDFKDLPKLVAKAKAGSESTLEVRREGKTRKLEVEIGRMPSDEVEIALAGSDAMPDSAKLGIHLAELTAEAREHYGISKESAGVLVVGVEGGSPASGRGQGKGGRESGTVCGPAPGRTPRSEAVRRGGVRIGLMQREGRGTAQRAR